LDDEKVPAAEATRQEHRRIFHGILALLGCALNSILGGVATFGLATFHSITSSAGNQHPRS
jgi:hypothetical protein